MSSIPAVKLCALVLVGCLLRHSEGSSQNSLRGASQPARSLGSCRNDNVRVCNGGLFQMYAKCERQQQNLRMSQESWSQTSGANVEYGALGGGAQVSTSSENTYEYDYSPFVSQGYRVIHPGTCDEMYCGRNCQVDAFLSIYGPTCNWDAQPIRTTDYGYVCTGNLGVQQAAYPTKMLTEMYKMTGNPMWSGPFINMLHLDAPGAAPRAGFCDSANKSGPQCQMIPSIGPWKGA